MRVVVLTPFWVSLWRIAALVLVGTLLAQLARLRVRASAVGETCASADRPWAGRCGRGAAVFSATLSAAVAPAPARAETPSHEMLEELGQRLSRPPTCAPTCLSVASSSVRIDGSTLELRLEAHAGATTVLRLPQAPQRWIIDSVLVDGSPARALSLDASGTLLTPLDRGVHAVSMSGRLVAADSLRLAFPARPARIEVTASGWEVSGVERGRLLGDGLSFMRTRTATAGGTDELESEEFPPYVRVTRTLTFDLDWRVDVQVERLAPVQGAFVIELPLLPGESVLTAGIPVRNGHVVIALPAGAQNVSWSSRLEIAQRIPLVAPSGTPWVEVWRLSVSPLWHIETKGTPEVFPQGAGDGGVWVRQFEPRPGESLELAISRPAGVEGATFAFERVDQHLAVGRRATDVTLQLDYRSTQGGRHVIKLPTDARLQSVQADGQPLTLDLRDGELALPLQPGAHSLQIAWQVESGCAVRDPSGHGRSAGTGEQRRHPHRAARGSLDAVRARRRRGSRHPLLGRARRVHRDRGAARPVRPLAVATRDWLLVGLGLSTFSWSVLLLFAIWVFAMQWRSGWRGPRDAALFNAVQVLLALLTVIALVSLLARSRMACSAGQTCASRIRSSIYRRSTGSTTACRERCRSRSSFRVAVVLQGRDAGVGALAQLRARALGPLGVAGLRHRRLCGCPGMTGAAVACDAASTRAGRSGRMNRRARPLVPRHAADAGPAASRARRGGDADTRAPRPRGRRKPRC